MNVLFTLTAYPPSIGGAQIHTHRLACALKAEHSVQVVSFWDSNRTDWLFGTTVNAPTLPQDYVLDGITIHRMGFSLTEKLPMVPFTLFYYSLMGISISALARYIGPHLEPFANKASLIHHVRIGREPLGFASLAEARRRGIPFVMTPLHHPRWGSWLHRYYQRLYQQADALIVLTSHEKQTLVSLGVDSRRISITGIGPVLASEGAGDRFRAILGIRDQPLILFLGQKYAYKGVQVLLQAAAVVWRKVPEAHFALIGPRTPYSRRLFKSFQDSRIHEMDAVDLQTKTDALDACQVLCLPSSQESFGGVFTEAWSLGKPVIACSIPAVSEIIQDGVNGFLVSQSASELADRILILLHNPDLGQRMGEAGRNLVRTRFSWDQIARLTEAAYTSALEGTKL